MKEGWKYKKLGDCCEVLNGFAFKSDKYVEAGTRVIRITNVQKGYIVDDDPKYYPDDEMSHLGQYCLYENDLLMSLTGNVGRVGLLQKEMLPAALNQRVACLRIKGRDISLRYLFHCLNSVVFEQKAIYSATGIAQKNMSTEWLKKYEIPVPSISEQERIVAELDCLSDVIEKKKQQLKELDNLARSIFYEMFGDPDNSPFPKHPLNYLSKLKLSYGSGASAVQYDGKIRYVRITDIQEDGKLDANAMSPSEYDDKYLLNDGDILFARSGATVGKTYHYKILDGKAIYAGYLIRFVPNQELVLPEYIFYFTKSDYYNAFIKKTAQAVAQPNINAKQYGDLLVCVPPIDLQQDFASKIEAIEKQKELIKQSIQETETLFNSRMDYYFA